MENKRLSEASSTECPLPEELCREILSRLPVKSLVRFRCVSKSWLYLINDPDFCRVHLNNFNNNRDETHLLVHEGSFGNKQKDFVIRRSDTFETSRETCLTLPPRFREGNWKITCVIDGLVLMKFRMFRYVDLLVWNPSIKKVYDIPPSPEIEVPRGRRFFNIEIGLGYDPLVKDYKLVKLILMGPPIDALHSVAVYTLGAGSWKIIQFHGNGCSNWHWSLPFPMIEAVYLEGSFYFICTDVSTDVLELVSFDLRTEVFSSISLPSSISNPKFVCNGCSSLVVFDIEYGSPMWVLESESVCWTQPYSFNFCVPEILYLKKNRDMLILWIEEGTCLSTGSEILEDGYRLVSSYNPATREEKFLLLQKESDSVICDVYGYIESLVMLK